jgi:hypothetical protein
LLDRDVAHGKAAIDHLGCSAARPASCSARSSASTNGTIIQSLGDALFDTTSSQGGLLVTISPPSPSSSVS